MAAPVTRSLNPAIREASRGLVEARDDQVAQIVAMVDAMPDRGAADHLIAPLRARLARTRPPRPLRFARLLFLPLDPLIVPAARWRPGQPSIPRTLIQPMADAIAAAMGEDGDTVRRLIEGHATRDGTVVEAAGAILWPRAAALLPAMAPPANWDATGLTVHLFRPLSRAIAALLAQAQALRLLMADAAEGLVPPEVAPVQAILLDAIRRDPDSQPMLIALLLARIPESGPVLARIAATLGHRAEIGLRHAGEQASDILLEQLESPGGAEAQIGALDLADSGHTVRRLHALLGAMDGDLVSPARRERLVALRARIDIGCQALFTERLSSDLLDPLRAMPGTVQAGPAWDLEDAARGLRALETEARRIGGAKTYDMLLGQAADRVREIAVQGCLGRAGGLRLMEILAGPEVALALVGAGAVR